MIRRDIVNQIGSKLNQMGIAYQAGNGADITVFAEFLDAGWSTGSKKVTYEASVFADEASNTVFMWEMTKETGYGLSFGGGSGSSFQSGKTLFRKVKSVQYGPEGKAYEYTLDLGAIPKAVKETAKQYGWKFKTVINKDKATYPAGYAPLFAQPGGGCGGNPQQPYEQAPQAAYTAEAGQAAQAGQAQQVPQAAQTSQAGGGFCTNCGAQLMAGARFCDKCGKPAAVVPQQPLAASPWQPPAAPPPASAEPQYRRQPPPPQPQYNNPQGPPSSPEAKRKSGGKSGALGLIGFILMGILLIMLAAGKATLEGWGISAAIFALAFFIQRKLSKKGCLLNLILWLVTGFILLVLLTIVTTESISFTTSGLKNAHMATAMEPDGKPADKVDSYPADAPQLVAVAELRNAPVNTKVKFVWKYVTGNILVNEFIMDSGNSGANVYVFSTLTNDKPWPEGKYRVEMYIEDRETPDAAVDFEVKPGKEHAAEETGDSSNKKERLLKAIELDVPEPWHRTGDTSLKDNLVFGKDLYGYSAVVYIASSFKIEKDAYDGTAEGFEKYFIKRDETHKLAGVPEKRKIGGWNAVRCLVNLMPGDPNFYFMYFIDVEGENDVVGYVLHTDKTEAGKLADEWENYWAKLKLIY